MSVFQDRVPHVANNVLIREPQQQAFSALEDLFLRRQDTTEASIVLPVGCGKSGCITLTPFALKANRALVIAPNLNIADQLLKDFDPSLPGMFYKKCRVLDGVPFPEPCEIRGDQANRSDLDDAEVVITNIQQLQGTDNRWISSLPNDYFDVIIFDEGHHSVAESYINLKRKFPAAIVINYSATPLRADGQLMGGEYIYSYPVAKAIAAGYVKRLKAVTLNPRTLRYVRREDGEEIEVSLDEVRRLGEEEADFRRSIVTSKETLDTIVDASIRQLEKLRNEAGERKLKIIASALNYEHCKQIVEAFRARGLRADYVHSREGKANDRVLEKLENHELDVIVQVRKLGEGFDHKYFSVAAVCSIFSNLSPFVQFVGRIMRVIEQNNSESSLNRGVVVFHAGANVARRWQDFREYSQADQAYFDELLPLIEEEGFGDEPREIEPGLNPNTIQVRGQSGVILEEISLLQDDLEAMNAIRLLRDRGYTTEDIREELEAVPTTKQKERQAMKQSLDMRSRNEAAKYLSRKGISPGGSELDTRHLGKTNLIVLKSAIDRKINSFAGITAGKRAELSRQQLENINDNFEAIVEEAIKEVFGAK